MILFTSGSEGVPKGVVLSHRNMLANCAQCLARIAANGEDKVFNVLPVFHSFGLTGGLMMPLVGGVPVYLYPSPLHYRIVPELVYGTNATILFGTDTFLNGYARAAHPYDLRSVRLIDGRRRGREGRRAQIYMEKFGVRILEGYGVTETAPVLAMNTPHRQQAGHRRAPVAADAGAAGAGARHRRRRAPVRAGPQRHARLLPRREPGRAGAAARRLARHGRHRHASTRRASSRIKGRAKRFAKIAGEMVSLSAVEALAAEAVPGKRVRRGGRARCAQGRAHRAADDRRALTREAFSRHARAKGAPELMVPAEILVVDKLPLLGSGKPDYVAATALAKAAAGAKEAKSTVAA